MTDDGQVGISKAPLPSGTAELKMKKLISNRIVLYICISPKKHEMNVLHLPPQCSQQDKWLLHKHKIH
jgi:hypothetical protein